MRVGERKKYEEVKNEMLQSRISALQAAERNNAVRNPREQRRIIHLSVLMMCREERFPLRNSNRSSLSFFAVLIASDSIRF